VIVYLIGLFQGLSLVAFPAAATILTSPSGYGLSESQYGLLFVPQVALAIAGSLALPTLGRRLGLKRVLLAGVAADTIAMALLVGSNAVRGQAAAFPLLLLATAALGYGFGTTLGAISTYAGGFMPNRREVALTGLNVLLGLGTALSPLLVSAFNALGAWWCLPLIAAAGLSVLGVEALREPLADPPTPGRSSRSRSVPRLFWIFAAALLCYGIAETMFGNWGTTLLVGRGVRPIRANDALAAFWAGVTVGRLVIALVSRRVRSTRIYVTLPWAMALVLVFVPTVHGAVAAIGLFALGGLACSGFFPMTIGYAEATFPDLVELATGWLIAAYQLGYGLAAFGGGALQSAVSLATLFRATAAVAVAMALLAIVVAGRQHPSRPRAPVVAPSTT
jgi:predicted MFS family arabinose efflux permease